jgi:transposase
MGSLHELAFRYFGGCTQYVVLDNLKEGVLKPDLSGHSQEQLNAIADEIKNRIELLLNSPQHSTLIH